MDFEDALDKATELLRGRGRVSLRSLKRHLGVDDEFLEDLRYELVDVMKRAREEEPGILTSAGEASAMPIQASPPPEPASAPASEPASEPEEAVAARAERRQLTVMFCDLVESTELSGRLDPEDLRDIVRAYQRRAEAVVTRYEGTIAQLLGDGLLIYFGYPTAHEEDPQRAVYAALGVVEEMGSLSRELEERLGAPLAVRIGIHTGRVVIGEVGGHGHRERLAVGQTPNVAARVQGEAEPGCIVVSDATRRLLRDEFEIEDLGPRVLKGVEDPIRVHRIVGTAARRSTEGASGSMVGRDTELALLHNLWRRSCAGSGQIALLSGEAGIGKTLMVREVRNAASESGSLQLVFRASPYHCNTALHPLFEPLQELFGLDSAADAATRLECLEKELIGAGLPLDEAVPLFAQLLAVELDGRYTAPTLSGELRRKRRSEFFIAWLMRAAAARPILTVWEDLQWADPSTIELLGSLLEAVRDGAVMALVTFRPEFEVPWPQRGTRLDLGRLDRGEIEAIIERLSGGRQLPTGVVEQIVAKTDGVPLFVEEVTKLLLESNLLRSGDSGLELVGSLGSLAVPTTLNDSLMARLDRLSSVREVAQLCAVLGRTFDYDLIRDVSTLPEEGLKAALAQLVEAELLFQRGTPPEISYVFKHALIQDVAYDSLLRSTQLAFHARVVEVLEASHPDTVAGSPEILAHHCMRAKLDDKSIHYWERAGEIANDRSALPEAIAHLEKALELLQAQPASEGRDQTERMLQIRLGAPLAATRGYGAEEVERAYQRALDLCGPTTDSRERFPATYGLWRTKMLRAQYGPSREHGLELLTIAEECDSRPLRIAAHRGLGACSFYLGEYASTLEHTARVLTLADESGGDRAKPMLDVYDVVDPRITSGCYSAWALWMRGRADESLATIRTAIQHSEEMNHPFSIALALSFATWLSQFRGEVEETLHLAQRSINYSEENGFPFWIGWGRVLEGWALAQLGRGEESVPLMREGLTFWKQRGSELGRSYFYCLLAEAQALAGDDREMELSLREARRFSERTSERFWEPERLRLCGESAMRRSDEDEGLSFFRSARDLAVAQEAVTHELRALTSLLRVRPRDADVRSSLEELVSRFGPTGSSVWVAHARKLLES